MAGGTLTIIYDDDITPNVTHTVNVGTVTSWSNSVTKKGSAYAIVTQDVQNSFPIENGNSQSYSFSFKHTNGQNGKTNAAWHQEMTAIINRWQARTDGCMIRYVPDGDNTYVQTMELEGYVKSLTLDYKNDYNEVISGTLEFSVGTMHVHVDAADVPDDAEDYNGMYILMSDITQNNWYTLLYGAGSNAISCVESVTISAGPESPFEYAVIEIPRKKLQEMVPALYGGIVDNMNKVYLNVLGRHDMFVQKVKSTEESVTVTAYCNAQIYRSKVLNNTYSDSPFTLMKKILTDASLGFSFPENNIVYKYDPDNDTAAGTVTMPKGTLVYRALQICANILGCRLFFADNKAYIIDYRVASVTGLMNNFTVPNVGDLLLRNGRKLGRTCVGKSECDPTGFDPVKNTCTITYSIADESGTDEEPTLSATYTTSEQVIDELSYATYGTLDKGTFNLPELNGTQAKMFAQNYLSYVREPQRAMTFTLKEVYHVAGTFGAWSPRFGPCTMATSITDDYNSEYVSNESVIGATDTPYYKLILSEYTRSYPKGTCKYTFGMIASITLSDNLSQTSNTLNTL